ncbi:MAG: hypothetical protein M5R42_14045 [Rhodocyclaceae bacterium]|nr:hypothetical protein [Rhodocyclaceae bacterium]
MNDHFIYSREAVEKDGEGMPTAFIVGEKKTRLPLAKVRRLQLMVPDTTDMERSAGLRAPGRTRPQRPVRARQCHHLDLGHLPPRHSQRGHPGRYPPAHEGRALRGQPDGPVAAGTRDPDDCRPAAEGTRAQPRSVSLYLKDDAPPVGCILGDFSDVSLRLLASPGQQALPPMKANDKVVVILNLGDAASIYRIRGSVLRTAADACVIKLKQLSRTATSRPSRRWTSWRSRRGC